MSTSGRLAAVGLVAASVMLAVLVTIKPAQSIWICVQAPYLPPPATLDDEDLAGTWETHYGRSVDTLILRSDGTFKQVYTSGYVEGYVYETGWESWGMQRLGDGRVRLRLEGARFYADGIAIAEEGGWGDGSGSFYDPITIRPVDMNGKLLLNVRLDPDRELILYQMWSTGDQGFAMTGCERDVFRRIEMP
jgi:hypothetical protein